MMFPAINHHLPPFLLGIPPWQPIGRVPQVAGGSRAADPLRQRCGAEGPAEASSDRGSKMGEIDVLFAPLGRICVYIYIYDDKTIR